MRRIRVTGFIWVASVVAFGPLAIANTLLVPSPAYPTIQSAIDTAVDGDEIVVAPGTYHETINFAGKAITVRSSDGAEVTTIDGTGLNDSVVKCVSGEGPGTVLQGFTVTGGTGDISTGSPRGGGMFVNESSPTIRACVFSGNTAYRGGGLTVRLGQAVVTACDFQDNSAEFGGGLELSGDGATVETCHFKNNIADGGGALYTVQSNATVTNSLFEWNKTVTTGPFVYGTGGAVLNYMSQPKFEDCVFRRNQADDGGAIFNRESTATFTSCTVQLNKTSATGGGVTNEFSDTSVADCRFDGNDGGFWGGGINDALGKLSIERTVFTDNRAYGGVWATEFWGGAIRAFSSRAAIGNSVFLQNGASTGGGAISIEQDSEFTIDHCTFGRNGARAVSLGDLDGYSDSSRLTITNSILYDGGGEVWNNDGSTVLISYSNVRGGFAGPGNIDIFAGYVGYRLPPNSPFINAGDPAFIVDDETDMEGNPRLLGCRTDMGAYESLVQQAIGDYDGNRIIDLKDFASFQTCMGATASASAWADVCVCSFDSSEDETVNVEDYAWFHAHLGEGRRPPPRIDRLIPAPGEWVVRAGGLSEVQIGFTEPILVPRDAIEVWTSHGTAVTGFTTSFDEISNMLTVRFAAPIVNNRITVVVDFTVTGLTGTELDGEILDPDHASLPSGDGLPGGQGIFQIDVLQGDANRDGIVNDADAGMIAKSLGLCSGDREFDAWADLNDDGCINQKDEAISAAAMGAQLAPKDGSPPMVEELEIDLPPLSNEFTIYVRFTEQIAPGTFQARGCFLSHENGSILAPSFGSLSGFANSATYWFDYPLDDCAGYLINLSNALEDFSGESLVVAGPIPCP
jgi:hypothetical protein